MGDTEKLVIAGVVVFFILRASKKAPGATPNPNEAPADGFSDGAAGRDDGGVIPSGDGTGGVETFGNASFGDDLFPPIDVTDLYDAQVTDYGDEEAVSYPDGFEALE